MLTILTGNNSARLLNASREFEAEFNKIFLWPELKFSLYEVVCPLSQPEQRIKAEGLVEEALQGNLTVITHSEIICLGIRLAIKQKKLRNYQVEFRFYDDDGVKIVAVDDNGRFCCEPYRFFNTQMDLLSELII